MKLVTSEGQDPRGSWLSTAWPTLAQLPQPVLHDLMPLLKINLSEMLINKVIEPGAS